MDRERIEAVGAQVVDACIEVHREMGPGLYESTYQACLSKELELRGIDSKCERELPVTYKGMKIDLGYRTDMIVGDCANPGTFTCFLSEFQGGRSESR